MKLEKLYCVIVASPDGSESLHGVNDPYWMPSAYEEKRSAERSLELAIWDLKYTPDCKDTFYIAEFERVK